MHATLNIKFVFDEATVPGTTAYAKQVHIKNYLTKLAEQAADLVGDDATATGYYLVDEVTHEITLTE